VRRYVISSTHFVRYSFDFSRRPSRSTSDWPGISESTSRKELCRVSLALQTVSFLLHVLLLTDEHNARFVALRPLFLPLLSLFSSTALASPPTAPALLFARSFKSACSNMRICLLSWSFSFFALRTSPSCFAILAFISALSMSHAFLARSWLCHSTCRKRITPDISFSQSSLPVPTGHAVQGRSYLAACTLFLLAHFHHLLHPRRPHSWLTATAMPWRTSSDMLIRVGVRSAGSNMRRRRSARARWTCRSWPQMLESSQRSWAHVARCDNSTSSKDCGTES
jgi:hypothetical protein